MLRNATELLTFVCKYRGTSVLPSSFLPQGNQFVYMNNACSKHVCSSGAVAIRPTTAAKQWASTSVPILRQYPTENWSLVDPTQPLSSPTLSVTNACAILRQCSGPCMSLCLSEHLVASTSGSAFHPGRRRKKEARHSKRQADPSGGHPVLVAVRYERRQNRGGYGCDGIIGDILSNIVVP